MKLERTYGKHVKWTYGLDTYLFQDAWDRVNFQIKLWIGYLHISFKITF